MLFGASTYEAASDMKNWGSDGNALDPRIIFESPAPRYIAEEQVLASILEASRCEIEAYDIESRMARLEAEWK